jgi:MFS transporter, MHS family, shikimate and dehydroshikimate transport protein
VLSLSCLYGNLVVGAPAKWEGTLDSALADISRDSIELKPPGRLTRVAFATMVGSAIEAFDFLSYGTAAALIFNKLFFPTFDPTVGSLATFGSFAAGFFVRPIGGIIFGHFGDRLGRKTMLTASLIMMGGATVLIGCLPTYAEIGIWAAVLLTLLRVAQGLSFGGELAGAMLMAVEHAPRQRKSFFGSLPQAGTPIGMLLSTIAFALVSQLPEQEFQRWGWRLPFLASAILVVVGIFIRLSVAESPEFDRIKSRGETARVPLREVVADHWPAVLLTIGGKLAEVTLYTIIIVFSLSFVTTRLGFSRGAALQAIMIGAIVQILTTPLFGMLADRFGARRLYTCSGVLLALMAVPLFWAIGSGSLLAYTAAVICGLSVNYASMYGLQSQLYAAQFPTPLRYTGMSIGIQIAAAIGGGLAPVVATTLLTAYGNLTAVGIYVGCLALISATCARLMKPASA